MKWNYFYLFIGQSEPSDPVSVKTDCNPPFRVQDLSVMTTESDSIIFTWTEPKYSNGTDLRYMVSNLEYLTSTEPEGIVS